MRLLFTFSIAMLICLSGSAQKTVSALFLGNSYTHRNDMLVLIENFAVSQNHELIYESNTPGGYRLQTHSEDEESLRLIRKRAWQFVVLQEQSQLPSFPKNDVENYVYPAVLKLDSIIKDNDSCTVTSFYRTWGRKNGDARNCPVWPPVCSYKGMDSLLALRYQKMADTAAGIVVPVGEVWRKVRTLYPNINLYRPDESHPSKAGSYLAACCFYTAFFREDPTESSYNYSLSDSTANRIKRLTKWVLFNQLARWNIGNNDPVADFDVLENKNGRVELASRSSTKFKSTWMYGDSLSFLSDSALKSDTVVFKFEKSGMYRIQLLVEGCNRKDSSSKWIKVQLNAVARSESTQGKIFVRNEAEVIKILSSENFEKIRFYNLSGQVILERNFASDFKVHKSILPEIFIVELSSDKKLVRKLLSR